MRTACPGAPGACLLVLFSTCAHNPTVDLAERDSYDRAYLALLAKQEGCLSKPRDACCEKLKDGLDAALRDGEEARAALVVSALAVSCAGFKREALATLTQAPKPIADSDAGGTVSVEYRVRLGRNDRLYWMGAFVDGRHAPGRKIPPGPHTLEVEAHLMEVTGAEDDQLFRIRASKEFEIHPGEDRKMTVMLERESASISTEPFRLDVLAAPMKPGKADGKATPTAVATANSSSPAPRIPIKVSAGRMKSMASPRMPRELEMGSEKPWSAPLKVCVNAEGRVESLAAILPQHPRRMAALLDAVSRAEYEPYRMNGKPIPFCLMLKVVAGRPPS
jgi:hypothetical protein